MFACLDTTNSLTLYPTIARHKAADPRLHSKVEFHCTIQGFKCQVLLDYQ